jgi:hypothetical protein
MMLFETCEYEKSSSSLVWAAQTSGTTRTSTIGTGTTGTGTISTGTTSTGTTGTGTGRRVLKGKGMGMA